MPKYKFEHEKKEDREKMTNCLQALLSFVGRDTALEVVMGTAQLTKWGVLNRLMDSGYQVIGSNKQFTIDTGCGVVELDCNGWELEFEDESFESYFNKRSTHLHNMMSKIHSSLKEESATANL